MTKPRTTTDRIARWNLFSGLATFAVLWLLSAVGAPLPLDLSALPPLTQRLVTWLIVYLSLVLVQVAWWAARRLIHQPRPVRTE